MNSTEEYKEWDKERVKIRNLVSRNPEIKQVCCICGKKGKILHNRQDPYYITFICDKCRKDKSNLTIAEESRFDVRTKLEMGHTSIRNFTDEMVIRIIIGFINKNITIGEYCKEIGISRYQFNQLQKYYSKLFPKHNIKKLIQERSEALRLSKIREGKVN